VSLSVTCHHTVDGAVLFNWGLRPHSPVCDCPPMTFPSVFLYFKRVTAGEVTPPRLMIDGCDVRSKAGVLNRREAPNFPVWAKQATPQEETVVR